MPLYYILSNKFFSQQLSTYKIMLFEGLYLGCYLKEFIMKWKIFKFVAFCYGTYKILSNALVRKLLMVFIKHESQKLLPKW